MKNVNLAEPHDIIAHAEKISGLDWNDICDCFKKSGMSIFPEYENHTHEIYREELEGYIKDCKLCIKLYESLKSGIQESGTPYTVTTGPTFTDTMILPDTLKNMKLIKKIQKDFGERKIYRLLTQFSTQANSTYNIDNDFLNKKIEFETNSMTCYQWTLSFMKANKLWEMTVQAE